MSLTELGQGQTGVIIKIKGRLNFRKRIMEMGFVVGKEVVVVRRTPFHGPAEYTIVGSHVVLRNSEAELIEVEIFDLGKTYVNGSYSGTFEGDLVKENDKQGSRTISVALIGNPISGKTSLFNLLTGSFEKVGNYSGVTVEPIERIINYKGFKFRLIDLPGTYSIGSEEHINKIIRDFIYNELPDVVINVVNATNLERNLFLTTDLIDMDVRLVMALNMYDEFVLSKDKFNHMSFGTLTGIPVVPVSATHGEGKPELLDMIINVFNENHPDQRHIHINYGEEIERAIRAVQSMIWLPENSFLTDRFSSRFLALRLLQKDEIAENRIDRCINKDEILSVTTTEIQRIEKAHNNTIDSIITEVKYGFVTGALKETYVAAATRKRHFSEKIDSVLLHKVFGFPVFIGIMWLMFASTFKLGHYPMTWIEFGVGLVSAHLTEWLPAGMLRDLLVNGVVSGMGGVLVFLPNILILYFFISLMEDTGYMSRAVFLMDRLMHKIGLHGKSFIPLIMGFGCNVPAILSSRILENRNERLVTILINPFISCNARLPVYILFISAFFPDYSATVLFSIYALGVILAIVTALLLKKTIFRKPSQPFVMELPPYRLPSRKTILMHMWKRSSQYLKKIGGVILIASVIFWALSYFPIKPKLSKDYNKLTSEITSGYEIKADKIPVSDTGSLRKLETEQKKVVHDLETEKKSEMREKSYLGQIGHFIEPVIRPLGFDWRIGISILSGIPAKEIIVSSLSILYKVDENDKDQSVSLVNKLKTAGNGINSGGAGNPITPLVALSFMIFVLLYLPCIGTLTAIVRESGNWKWGAFTVIYTFSVAWLMSFLVYQAGTLLGF